MLTWCREPATAAIAALQSTRSAPTSPESGHPYPALASQELISEMGEVYWMALSRDIPFTDWGSDTTIQNARESLARLWWFRQDRTDRLTGSTDVLPTSLNRRRVLSQTGADPVPLQQLFRGLLP